MEIGYAKGEVCNRDGCAGIIDQHESNSGCSCHINPPCGYCETSREYCPVCEWDGREEQIESQKIDPEIQKKNQEYFEREQKKWDEARELFNKKFRGEIPADKVEIRSESHTHFSMKRRAVFPKGTNWQDLLPQLKGSFGGRLSWKNDYSLEYIAYTD